VCGQLSATPMHVPMHVVGMPQAVAGGCRRLQEVAGGCRRLLTHLAQHRFCKLHDAHGVLCDLVLIQFVDAHKAVLGNGGQGGKRGRESEREKALSREPRREENEPESQKSERETARERERERERDTNTDRDEPGPP
jgi:hypothetical protein